MCFSEATDGGLGPQTSASESVLPFTQGGWRSRDVDLRDPRRRYEMLADFGLGRTEDGRQRCCAAQVVLEDGPGYIELGVEQTVLVGLYCPDAVVQPTVSFDLSEGPKVVARATVLSVLETTVPE